MVIREPGKLTIRNRRYRPWGEIVGVMLLILFVAVLFLPLFFNGGYGRLAKWSFLAVVLGMAGYCLRTWFLILDLTERPLPGRRETARVGWNWALRGVRPRDPYRFRVAIALALFGWLTPKRISVAWLNLRETVEFDSRVPLRAGVEQVRFAPDPAEDYVELEQPDHHCEAAVELSTGKEFRLILDEADAGLLRQWAVEKGIPVCDSDGYSPRMAGQICEARRHE